MSNQDLNNKETNNYGGSSGGCHHRHNAPVFKCKNICSSSPVSTGGDRFGEQIANIITPRLDRFQKPCTKVDFSTLVTLSGTVGFNQTLVFKLYRPSHYQYRKDRAIKTITIPLTGGAVNPMAMPLNFSYCDCDDYCHESKCSEYIITAQLTGDADINDPLNITFTCGTISILSSDAC